MRDGYLQMANHLGCVWDGSSLGSFEGIKGLKIEVGDFVKIADSSSGIADHSVIGYIYQDNYLAAILDRLRTFYRLRSLGTRTLQIDDREYTLINSSFSKIEMNDCDPFWKTEVRRNLAFYRLFGVKIRASRLLGMIDEDGNKFAYLLDRLELNFHPTIPSSLRLKWGWPLWDFRREISLLFNIHDELSYTTFYVQQLGIINRICGGIKSSQNIEGYLILAISKLNPTTL